jgi:hypothetical protein
MYVDFVAYWWQDSFSSVLPEVHIYLRKMLSSPDEKRRNVGINGMLTIVSCIGTGICAYYANLEIQGRMKDLLRYSPL